MNRQSPVLLFFYNLVNLWSKWMFYFLLVVTGYWFIFTKTTAQTFIFLPDDSQLYLSFYAIAGLMIFFRLLVVALDKKEKLSTHVFLINWEKDKTKNCWREIFIVNSLAEFYTYRTISFFWVLLVHLFFLVGFDWQQHAAEVAHTDLGLIRDLHPRNPILLYFLSGSLLLLIGVAFKSKNFVKQF